MHLPIRRVVLSYGIAAAGVVLAGLSHWWLAPFLGDTPPVRLLLVIVVMASAWLGGLGPGLFATILGLLAIVAANDAPGDLASLANRLVRFGSLGLLITFLFKGLHASRHRAEMKDETSAAPRLPCMRRSPCSTASTNHPRWPWASSSKPKTTPVSSRPTR